MIEHPALVPYADWYATGALVPLTVTAVLRPGSRMVAYDPITLDGVLSRAVVDEATAGAGLPPSSEPYSLPLPFQRWWQSPEGLPLWAATAFVPKGVSARDVTYWHKRAQSGAWSAGARGTLNVVTVKGRWKEHRTPMPVIICERWSASAVGDPEEIARLLAPVAYLGKKRAWGMGEIERWEILPAERVDLVMDGRLVRSLPTAAASLLVMQPKDPPVPIAWTPPAWLPGGWLPGWPAGTEVGDG